MNQINDIVTFNSGTGELNGIIQKIKNKKVTIKGCNAKIYEIPESNIIESIGKAYVNKARKNAESWQTDKAKNPEYEDAKEWENTKKSLFQ